MTKKCAGIFQNLRWKVITKLFVLLAVITLTQSVFAEKQGSITVYVKDQNGDNLNCYESECTNHIFNPLIVELYKNNEIIDNKTFPSQYIGDTITFDVNETGPYVIRAYTTLRFADKLFQYHSCALNATPTQGGLAGLLFYGSCEAICPSLIKNLVPDPYFNESYYTSFSNDVEAADDDGPYRCGDMRCTWIHNGTESLFWLCGYARDHRYTMLNEVLTYVDKDENDTAQVTLLSNKWKLGGLGKKYGDTILNISMMKEIFKKDNLTDIYKAIEILGSGGIGQLIGEEAEASKDTDYGKIIFGRGGFRTAVSTDVGSSVIILGVKGLVDREGYEEDVRNWKYIPVEMAASATSSYALAYALGITSTGGTFVLGVIVATPIKAGVDFTINEETDSKLCKNADTDDFDIFIGDKLSDNISYNYIYQSYPIAMINKGTNVSKIAVGPDYDPPLESLCGPYTMFFKPYTILDNVTHEPVEYSVNLSINQIETNTVSTEVATWCYTSFNETGRLRHEIQVLPEKNCDFDTSDLFSLGGLFYSPLDVPKLSRFQKHVPYIANPSYPSVVHRGDLVNVTAGVVFDEVIVSGVNVSYTVFNSSGSKVSNNTVAMNVSSGSGLYKNWSASINTSTFPVGGIMRFNISILMLTQITNDNDQTQYETQIVDDANSGHDAGNTVASAVSVNLSSTYQGHLIPNIGDDRDVFSFPVSYGNRYTIYVNGSGAVPLNIWEVNSGGSINYRTDLSELILNSSLNGTANVTGNVMIVFNSLGSTNLDYSFSITKTGSGLVLSSGTESGDEADTDFTTTFICGGDGEGEADCASILSLESEGGFTILTFEDSVLVGVSRIGTLYYENFADYINEEIDLDYDISEEECDNTPYYYEVDVTVCCYYNTSSGFHVEVDSIVPYINNAKKDCAEQEYDGEVVSAGGDCHVFTAIVPLDSDYSEEPIAMRVNYRRVGSSTSLPFSPKTEPFELEIEATEPPTLDEITSTPWFNSVRLDVSADEGSSSLDYAKFYINGSSSDCGEKDFDGGTATCIWNTTSKAQGTYNVYAKVYGTDGKWFETEPINVTVRNDAVLPVVGNITLTSTDSGTVYNNTVSGLVQLSSLAYDSDSGSKNISWYVNNSFIGSGNILNWSTAGLNGNKTLRIQVTDKSGNTQYKTLNISVDNIPPNLSIVSPVVGANVSGWVYLEASVNDSSDIDSVYWYLGLPSGEKVLVGSGEKTYWGAGGLDGTYPVIVNASDVLGNSAEKNVSVNFKSPDLFLNSSLVFFSGNSSLVWVNVTVNNLGTADADNVYLKLYDGWNETASTELGSLAAGAQASELMNWTNSSEGLHNLTLVVDPADYVTELNESNNYATIEVNITSNNITRTTLRPYVLIANIQPASGYSTNQLNVNLSFIVAGSNATYRASLNLNGLNNNQTMQVANYTVSTFNLTNLNSGTYSWNVTAYINDTIYATSETWNFTVNAISSYWCYQESANVSTACGGLSTGKYGYRGTWVKLRGVDNTPGVPRLADGDWSSGASTNETTYSDFFINYTKPTNSLDSSMWQVKDLGGTVNISIPAACWSNDTSKIKLKATSYWSSSFYVNWSCWNNTAWYLLKQTTSDPRLYEEAMQWNIALPCEGVKPIIFSAAQTHTNYPLLVHTYWGSSRSSNFSDIRFYSANKTALNYYLENYSSSEDAFFWVNVSTITQGNVTQLYMCYNSSSTSLNNGNKTFLKFVTGSDAASFSCGTKHSAVNDNGNLRINSSTGSGDLCGLTFTAVNASSMITRVKVPIISNSYVNVFLAGQNLNNRYLMWWLPFFNSNPSLEVIYNDSIGTYSSLYQYVPSDTYFIYRADWSNNRVNHYYYSSSYSLGGNLTNVTYPYGSPTTTSYLGIGDGTGDYYRKANISFRYIAFMKNENESLMYDEQLGGGIMGEMSLGDDLSYSMQAFEAKSFNSRESIDDTDQFIDLENTTTSTTVETTTSTTLEPTTTTTEPDTTTTTLESTTTTTEATTTTTIQVNDTTTTTPVEEITSTTIVPDTTTTTVQVNDTTTTSVPETTTTSTVPDTTTTTETTTTTTTITTTITSSTTTSTFANPGHRKNKSSANASESAAALFFIPTTLLLMLVP